MNKTLKKLEIAVKRMTLRQWAIVVSCAFVLSMIYQWNQLDTKDAGQDRRQTRLVLKA